MHASRARSVQVRGLMLGGVRKHAAERFGDEALLAAVSARSRGVAKALRGVVEGAWYPIGWLATLDQAMVDVSGAEDAVRRFARETSEIAFRRFAGGASVAPRLLRPREVLERSATLLTAAFTGVSSRIVADGERDQHRRFDTDEPLPTLVWDHFRGGLAGVVEATGASEVHVVDVAGGGEECFLELRVSW